MDCVIFILLVVVMAHSLRGQDLIKQSEIAKSDICDQFEIKISGLINFITSLLFSCTLHSSGTRIFRAVSSTHTLVLEQDLPVSMVLAKMVSPLCRDQ